VLATLDLDEPFLLMNGNVLTTLDLRRFHDAHLRSGDAATIGTHRREVVADYGVVQTGFRTADGGTTPVRQYVDKPTITHTVSMGVYAMQPGVADLIDDGERLGIPTLIERAIGSGHRVGAYEYEGLWLDLRRQEDYEQAIERYEEIAPFFAEPAERRAA
jgi:NDP-mannose synthase